jgi:hypothetical protein
MGGQTPIEFSFLGFGQFRLVTLILKPIPKLMHELNLIFHGPSFNFAEHGIHIHVRPRNGENGQCRTRHFNPICLGASWQRSAKSPKARIASTSLSAMPA